jgi:peptidoglycan/LPS O-acetylase OafA/YrhL
LEGNQYLDRLHITMSKVVDKNRYLLLDGTRGIAAISVVFFHFYLWQIDPFKGIPIAVDFFFVLSGFVLGPGLFGPRRYTRKKFILGRIFRLYPTIFVSFAIILLTQYIPALRATSTAPRFSFMSYLLAILLLQIFVASIYAINVPLWSLSAEFFVNTIAVFFGSQRRTISILITIGFLLELVSIFNNLKQYSSPLLFNNINLWWIGRSLVGFNLGLLLYIKNSTRNRALDLSISVYPKCIKIILLVILSVLLASYSGAFVILAAPFFYFVIGDIISLNQLSFPLIYRRLCIWLGEISYGIYIFHLPVNEMLSGKFLETYLHFDLKLKFFLFVGLLIKLLGTLLVAMFSLRFVERPFRHWATKRFIE